METLTEAIAERGDSRVIADTSALFACLVSDNGGVFGSNTLHEIVNQLPSAQPLTYLAEACIAHLKSARVHFLLAKHDTSEAAFAFLHFLLPYTGLMTTRGERTRYAPMGERERTCADNDALVRKLFERALASVRCYQSGFNRLVYFHHLMNLCVTGAPLRTIYAPILGDRSDVTRAIDASDSLFSRNRHFMLVSAAEELHRTLGAAGVGTMYRLYQGHRHMYTMPLAEHWRTVGDEPSLARARDFLFADLATLSYAHLAQCAILSNLHAADVARFLMSEVSRLIPGETLRPARDIPTSLAAFVAMLALSYKRGTTFKTSMDVGLRFSRDPAILASLRERELRNTLPSHHLEELFTACGVLKRPTANLDARCSVCGDEMGVPGPSVQMTERCSTCNWEVPMHRSCAEGRAMFNAPSRAIAPPSCGHCGHETVVQVYCNPADNAFLENWGSYTYMDFLNELRDILFEKQVV